MLLDQLLLEDLVGDTYWCPLGACERFISILSVLIPPDECVSEEGVRDFLLQHMQARNNNQKPAVLCSTRQGRCSHQLEHPCSCGPAFSAMPAVLGAAAASDVAKCSVVGLAGASRCAAQIEIVGLRAARTLAQIARSAL